jgi:hypothetical protein
VIAAKAGAMVSLKLIGVLGVTSLGVIGGAIGIHGVNFHRLRSMTTVARSSSDPNEHGGAAGQPSENDEKSLSVVADPARKPTTAAAPPAAKGIPVEGSKSPSSGEAFASSAVEFVPASASTLRAELTTLDEAREAISARNTTRALGILDGYDLRFPTGAMRPEATVLRIEALLIRGDRRGAERCANGFLGSSPKSPYAARVRSLLAGKNP